MICNASAATHANTVKDKQEYERVQLKEAEAITAAVVTLKEEE